MRKLLLIDDDEGLAGPLQKYFAKFDMSLDSETQPLEAIERIRQQPYDLVVLDVMLPQIDGFETCRRIRHFSDIPILMLTARGEVMDRVVGLERHGTGALRLARFVGTARLHGSEDRSIAAAGEKTDGLEMPGLPGVGPGAIERYVVAYWHRLSDTPLPVLP